MALTGETPFENLLIETLNRIENKQETLDNNQKETCNRLTTLETKWESAIDQKIKNGDKKYRIATIAVTAFAGLSWVWNLIPHK